jgi:CelD/BcsL family acetyltransferase involved in cellulose biosynthesis
MATYSGVVNTEYNECAPERIFASVRTFEELDATLIAQWRELEQYSAPGNAWLSADFVLPAARYLAANTPRVVVSELVRQKKRKLVGIGFYMTAGPNRHLPFPHLKLFHTKHTFVNGFLLDQQYAQRAFLTMIKAIFEGQKGRLALFVPELQADSETYKLLTSSIAADIPYSWVELERYERPILRTAPNYIETHYSRKKKKKLRSCWRKLEQQGKLQWQLLRQTDNHEAVETFLRLEHMSWKGKRGTSLLSQSNDAEFFREMVTNFAIHKDTFFCELLLDEQPIASTSNFISGGTGFAFKLGWDPQYRIYAPGILNELEFIRQAPNLLKDISYIDSGSQADSFIGRYWVDRYQIVSGLIVPNGFPLLVLKHMGTLRDLKRQFIRRI